MPDKGKIRMPEIAKGIKGLISRKESHYLYRVCDKLGPGKYVDLGTFCGRSAVLLAGGLRDRGCEGSVVTVDLFNQTAISRNCRYKSDSSTLDYALRIFEDKDVSEYIYPLQMKTIEAADVMRHCMFRFIFIDATHKYRAVKADFEAWVPLLDLDGLVAFHDTHLKEIDRFMQEMPEYGFKQVDQVDSMKVWGR